MHHQLKALSAAMLAAASIGSAAAADTSPLYVGADMGQATDLGHGLSGRAYVGYNFGGNQAFGLEQVHSVELMAFSLGLKRPVYDFLPGFGGDPVRSEGLAINWATVMKLNERWSINTRLGVDYAWTTTHYRYGSGHYTYERPGVLADVGIGYKLTPNLTWTANLGYMPVKIDQNDKAEHPVITTGLRFGF